MIQYGYMPNGALADMEIEALCAKLRGIGYTGIELLPPLALVEGDKLKRLLNAVAANELTISEVVLQRDFVVPDKDEFESAVDFVTRSIPMVADLGVHTVNLFTGPQPWLPRPVVVGRDITQTDAWGLVFSAFDRILPVAERYGVRIAVENVFGMMAHDLFSNLFLQNHYSSKMLGVNLDPSHDVLYGNTDMRFLVETWGKSRIFHVHLKDAVGIPACSKFLFPLLGEGEVDWKTFFKTLNQIGYDGFASVEFESWNYIQNLLNGDNESCTEISFRAIQNLTKDI